MAKGQQQSFGHYLSGLFRFATESMYDPRLRCPSRTSAFLCQLSPHGQQLVEGTHAMYHHGLFHAFCYVNLCSKSLLLLCPVLGVSLVQATLTYGPHLLVSGLKAHDSYCFSPTIVNLPGMQSHRKSDDWIFWLSVCWVTLPFGKPSIQLSWS